MKKQTFFIDVILISILIFSCGDQPTEDNIINKDLIYVGTFNGIFTTSDFGTNWKQTGLENYAVTAIIIKNDKLMCGTNDGLFYSYDLGNSWFPYGFEHYDVRCIVEAGSGILYMGTDQGLFRSLNKGFTWQITGLGENQSIFSIHNIDNELIASVEFGKIYKSNDAGISWELLREMQNSTFIFSLNHSGSYIYIGTDMGIYRTNLSNDSLTFLDSGLPTRFINVYNIFIESEKLIFIGTNWGLYSAELKNDINWVRINTGLPDKPVYVINNYQENNLILGTGSVEITTEDGVYVSSDQGVSWESKGLSGEFIWSIFAW
jgi:ligand-binding sensor domain-containing protein